MKILITGIAGFIGSNLAATLVKMGHTVVGLDNLSTGKMSNLKDVRHHIDFTQGDIRDFDLCKHLCKDTEYVLHQAALGSVPRSIEFPIESAETNILGTLNVFKAALETGVKRVVYASSSSVYGDARGAAKHEEDDPLPMSPYAVTKHTNEEYAKVFHVVHGLELIGLRYFNVFGPKQNPEGPYAAAIPKFIDAMLNDRPPIVYGDGEQSRDFTYIYNVVYANLDACVAPYDAANGDAYNIGTGKPISINELIRTIAAILDVEVEPEYQKKRRGDVLHSQAVIKLAKEWLGYHPRMSFFEGLVETIEWHKRKCNG